MRKRPIAIGVLVVVALLVVAAARGPVGPESVLGKDVADLVANAALRAGASVASQAATDPNGIGLPFALELKRRLKRTLGRLGVMFAAPETATEFLVRSRAGANAVRCVVLCRGDHVIGVIVVYGAAHTALAGHLRSALESGLPGLRVQESQTGD
jgi:hypothetical protein